MSDDRDLHAHLIGQQGGRRSLNTPVLVVDRAALDRNIATMAARAAAKGVALRPHAKTHKSVDIARRQLAAGAIGICCAKLGEAEVMVAGGITGVHIPSPVVTAPAIARLAALHDRATGLMVVVDDPANVAAQVEYLARVLPGEVLPLLKEQMTRITSNQQAAGIGRPALPQMLGQPGDALDVEVVGRLVQGDDVPFTDQQLGQLHPAPLAAAERGNRCIPIDVRYQPAHHIADARIARPLMLGLIADQRPADGMGGVEGIGLAERADPHSAATGDPARVRL